MGSSKFGAFVLFEYALDRSVVNYFSLRVVKNSCYWLHYASAIFFEVFECSFETFSDSINRLYSLDGVRLGAVSKDIEFFEFGYVADHVLNTQSNTFIYPIELAIPAP